MVIFKKLYNPKLEIPRGVCPDCWENGLNKKVKNILREQNISLTKPHQILAFTIDYIKNFERDVILKNNKGSLYCPRCKSVHENYDFIDLQLSRKR